MAKSFYGLIGYPLTHSFSPGYFNQKFREEGLDAIYTSYPLPDISLLPALLKEHPQLRGLNVTIPYKTAVLPYLDEMNMDVQQMGAANCIRIEEGKLIGYNSDWTAFRDSLQPLLRPEHTQALILGNGGAAKAVAYALRQMGIAYRIVSRGRDSNTLSYERVTPALLQDHLLLINTTPLGMFPEEDSAPEIPYEALTSRHLLYDLIYNPAATLFLKKGAAQDAITKNGLEMLHLQAEGSWRIWMGA